MSDNQNDNNLSTEVSSSEQVLDLDSADRFRYGGQEYSKDDFKSGWMRQSDYTKKTQEVAEQKRQWEHYRNNLDADLERVKSNPALAQQFRTVYPKEFHSYLDRVVGRQPNQQGMQQSNRGLDPALEERLSRYEKFIADAETNAIQKELDASFSTFSKKFPQADEKSVISDAWAILDHKERTGDKTPITDAQWERMWKDDHERNLNRFKQYQGSLVNGQKQANARSKDMAAGGGIPGQAPRVARNIKEATKLAMQHLDEI